MYGLAQGVLRARKMRQRWANLPSTSREGEAVLAPRAAVCGLSSAAAKLLLPSASQKLRARSPTPRRSGSAITSTGGEAPHRPSSSYAAHRVAPEF